MAAEGQSDKMTSDMEVLMKQRCVIEFLHAEKIAPKDIHRRLLNVYGDQTVDVSTVRRWVARFSSGDSDVKDKPRSGRLCTAVTPRNEERLDLDEPGQTINSDRYIATATKLKARISRVRPEKKTTFLLQHDNARPHASLKTVEHIVKLGWTVLPHPSYSLDLAPSDFHLFRPMKDGLCGQHFPSNNVIIAAVKQWTTSAGADFYERGVQALVHRWRKCIANGGDYVKK